MGRDRHDVQTDEVLSNLSFAYTNGKFVGEEVYPLLKVKKDSGIYYKYDKANEFDIPDAERAPRTESNQVSMKYTKDTYACVERSLKDLIDDIEKDNADKPLNLQMDATLNVKEKLKLIQEKKILDIIFSGTVFSGKTAALAAGARFDNYTGTSPNETIETYKEAFRSNAGRDPNVGVITKDAFRKVIWHPAVTDQLKHTSARTATAEILAKMWGLDKLVVASAKYNTAKKGQTVSLSDLATKKFLLAYVTPRPGLKVFTLGITMYSKKDEVKKWRDNGKHSDVVEVTERKDEKTVSTDAGYLLTTVIS